MKADYAFGICRIFLNRGGGEKRMKKGLKITALLIIAIMTMVPIASSVQVEEPAESSLKALPEETTQLICTIDGIDGKGSKAVVELPMGDIESIKELAEASKDAFLVIYNKYSTDEEVTTAFEEVQPLFEALVDNGLTDKSVEELNELFYKIRGKIRKPRVNPIEYMNDGGAQTCGMWNGIPTPIFPNIMCGIVNIGGSALGFTLGTHSFIPTIGIDLLTMWVDVGETVSIGALGFTTSTGPEFGFITGFIGIMLATPIMILGVIFQIGFALTYIGVGPAPF